MKSICVNCEYWGVPEDDGWGNIEKNEWHGLEMDYDMKYNPTKCSCPKIKEFDKCDEDGAIVQDGSNYSATLYTAPKFGCIHFKEKK